MNKKELGINQILLPYAAILAAMCATLQIVIAIRGHQIDVIAGLLTAVVALYYAYSQMALGRSLRKIRFGQMMHHVIAFAIVNLSFHIHAGYLIASGQGEFIKEQWYGVLFAMFIFWGLGFLTHLISSIALRGYEEIEV